MTLENGGGRWDTFSWRRIALDDGGIRWEYDGERWDTWDNAVHYGITTLVLKICKNLLGARRLEQTFAPRPLPAEHTFAYACGSVVDNFLDLWITSSKLRYTCG